MLKKVGNPNLWVQFEQKVCHAAVIFSIKSSQCTKKLLTCYNFSVPLYFLWPWTTSVKETVHVYTMNHAISTTVQKMQSTGYIPLVHPSDGLSAKQIHTVRSLNNWYQEIKLSCSWWTAHHTLLGKKAEGRLRVEVVFFFFVCLFINNLLLFLFSQRYTMKFTTHNTSLVLLGFWAPLLIQYFRLASTFSL